MYMYGTEYIHNEIFKSFKVPFFALFDVFGAKEILCNRINEYNFLWSIPSIIKSLKGTVQPKLRGVESGIHW